MTLFALLAQVDAGQAIEAVKPAVSANGIVNMLFNTVTLGIVVSAVLGLAAMFVSGEVRRRRVALAVYHAYHIVVDIDHEASGNSTLDKIATGLKAADDWMIANKWRPLTTEEQDVAKLDFKAINGQAIIAATKVP